MKHEYGVFVWRGDARYNVKDAVKTFVRMHVAQRHADKLNDDPKRTHSQGYVVRTLRYCLGSTE